MNYLIDHPLRVAALAAGHLELVALALVAALAFAVPLGVFAARRPEIAPWLLGTLGAIYTIPSLALLAVFVQWFGLGFTPIFVALVVYAQFMLARNIAAGITGVDRAQVDAARGSGMSARQNSFARRVPASAARADRRHSHRGDRHDRDRHAGWLRRRCRPWRADIQWLDSASAADDRRRQRGGFRAGNRRRCYPSACRARLRLRKLGASLTR